MALSFVRRHRHGPRRIKRRCMRFSDVSAPPSVHPSDVPKNLGHLRRKQAFRPNTVIALRSPLRYGRGSFEQLRCKLALCRSIASSSRSPRSSRVPLLVAATPRSSHRSYPMRGNHLKQVKVQSQSQAMATRRQVIGQCGVSPNKRMQPTHQPVIKFACANLPPVWRAADAWRWASHEKNR
jgi:hypothetical protein